MMGPRAFRSARVDGGNDLDKDCAKADKYLRKLERMDKKRLRDEGELDGCADAVDLEERSQMQQSMLDREAEVLIHGYPVADEVCNVLDESEPGEYGLDPELVNVGRSEEVDYMVKSWICLGSVPTRMQSQGVGVNSRLRRGGWRA